MVNKNGEREIVPNDRFADEEAKWDALACRDRTAHGAFYYAVKTTSIFCRAGCSSRLPKRQNVEFFDTCNEAQLAGYRPCKRCKPDSNPPREQLTKLMVRACRQIEQAETCPTLKQLANDANLSPWYFHRLFREVVGVTPKQYANTNKAERFRKSLTTERTVTKAIYHAGFSSSSRAYDSARDRLAMTPSAYKKRAAGLVIQYGITQCFLGWVIVAATEHGICAIELGDDPESLPLQIQKNFRDARLEEGGADFLNIIERVITFIEAPGKGIELPLDIQGTAFQERVWNALRQIPPGSTESYADIAIRIGSPQAVRAVAQACAANKLALAVPCHRAIRSDGALSGYRWGVERKRLLLNREKPGSEGT